ncbi:N-acetylglutaminylglutamine amidotransferase [Thermoleophilia bacterium SCSIO 60948]|nr:N-acetylglutaminylglutamine amidotransferase [Thermoleophilia bacterium SCSIO 60948]
MCGFAGEIVPGGIASRERAERMAARVAPRGPDGDGSWAEGQIALAHRRLKIIDLSETGSQPMVDDELGIAIVFNGCIYNYPQLREELTAEGYRFFSTSDTEVLIKAYHRWGLDFVDHLLGMFAFALVERGPGRMILGRDRLGIKPLYHSEVDGSFRFASTPQALIAGGGVDTSVDPVALHHYMSWHAVVPAPRTVLSGVRKLGPGRLMVIEPDGSREERVYWRPDFSRDSGEDHMDAADWQDAVLGALRLAVERRMVADVPVGVLLSGGLDSSLIVALLAEQGQTGLETFSVGFESVGGRSGDEFHYSDLVAERYGTVHHRDRVPVGRLVDALPDAIAAQSEPMVSHDNVAFFLLSEQVSKHVKVVQSGQGADEVFAGYHWYEKVADADADGSGFETYRSAFFDGDHSDVRRTVTDAYLLDHDPSERFVRRHFGRPGADEPVDRALRIDTEVMLVDDPVKRVDNMTMAWGVEARVPFLDHELVELAARCPPELKLDQEGKGVLKDAGRRLLPSEVIDRPKGYFPVPAISHLEGKPLEMVREALLSRAAANRSLFRPDEVRRLLDAPNEHMTNLDGNRLWQLGTLEMWLQTLEA